MFCNPEYWQWPHNNWKLKLNVSIPKKNGEQNFKTLLGEIISRSEKRKFCISKNMALFLYVLRMKPCF